MGLLFAFLSVVGECTGKTIDKLNFRRNQVGARQLMLLIFSGMTISLFVFILLTRQPLPHFSMLNVVLLLLVALVSFGANAFDNRSLKVNGLSLREPLLNLKPMFAGFIAYVLFPSERKP